MLARPALARAAEWLRGNAFLVAAAVALILSLVVVGLRMQDAPPTADADRYRTMAISFWRTGEFRAEHVVRAFEQPGEVENGHTHYFSPLWPLFMLPFWLALGQAGFELAFLVACGLALAAGGWVTRRLWGDAAAFATVACTGVSLGHVYVQRAAEPLALVFWFLMLYGIFRSLEPSRGAWIILAGASAGLAYLTRSSVGWLFLVGGGAGFAWRLAFHKRQAFNRHYVAAIGIALACWSLWALRNLYHFWDGSLQGLVHAMASDAVFEWKFRRAAGDPVVLAWTFLQKVAWGFVLLAPFVVLRWRSLSWQLRNFRDETASGLVLSWAVPWVIGAFVAAVFTLSDVSPGSPVANLDNVRYFIFAVPGLMWGPWPPVESES